ncbi:MAG: cytochrome c peroxidase [Bacteroidota bacterium]
MENRSRKNSREKSYYMPLFVDAFGSAEITTEKISKALSSFCSSINTNNTRFDQFNQTRFMVDPNDDNSVISTNSVLNPLEVEGMFLFSQKYDCNSCHNVQSTIGYIFAGTFANIGLEKDYSDPGRQNCYQRSCRQRQVQDPFTSQCCIYCTVHARWSLRHIG